MATISQYKATDGTVYDLKDNISGYTKNTGTVTSVSGGTGLSGSVSTSGSIKANLRSETALTVDSNAATTTSGRVYPVAVDKSGYLAVNVPWTDTSNWTTHLYAGTSSGTANGETSNGGTHLILADDSTVRNRVKITGSGATTVTSDSSGNITITSTDSKPVTSVNSKTGAVNLTYSDVSAASSSHTHTASIATDSGTNQLSMAAGTKYKLTAGGSSFVFTTPPDNNTTYSSLTAASGGTDLSLVTTGEKYTWNSKANASHTHSPSEVGLGNVGNFKAVSTVASQGLSSTEQANARANIGAGTSSLTIGTTASTAAAGNHTHSAYVNQNAFSNVTVGETTVAADSATDTLTLVAGTNVTITPDATNDKITISATDTNTWRSISDSVSSTSSDVSASSKAVKTAYDLAASKTANTGTVTSVGITNGGGLTVSGSPVTTSGSITLTVDGSAVINNLSAGDSNATRDDYIVAQYAGGGTTTKTYHRRSIAKIFAALNSSDVTTALGFTPATSTHTHDYSSVYAAKSHGNHVPATETANNAKFLRNDNSWQIVTPANIGAASSSHTHDYSSTYAAKSHTHTPSEVGLGNVGNFKAVSTVASQRLTDTEKSNARANIGAGTSNLTIGTTASTAAAGNHTHDYSSTYAAKSHTHSPSEVGLGNVGNFKAVSTVASQGLSSTEQANARANIGAGTSSLTIGTTASTAAAGNHTHSYAGSSTAGGTAYTASELVGTYSGNGGQLAPNAVTSGRTRVVMMNNPKGLSGFPTYADCLLMDNYTGSDVPWITGLGIIKQDASPRMFIFNGAKGNTTTWKNITEVLTTGNYTSTVTPSSIGAAASSHTHTKSEITDFPASLPASDVYSWAKASSKPSYTASEVGAAASSHTHTKSEITDFPASLPASDVYSWAKASSKPSYTASEVGAAASSHTHGNIQSGGALQTTDITIASGDKLVVTDSSNSNKVARTSISFDGSTTTKALTQKGTWETFGTSNLTIGTTATTAAAGNHTHDYSSTYAAKSHTHTASEVGLGNVGNFKAVSTVASQRLTDTEKSNARANIGAGTSSLTIGTTASTAAAGNHTHDYSSTYAAKSHTHKVADITDFPASLPASDVYSWAKASSKPSYTASEVGAATSGHTHEISIATDSGTNQLSMAANTKYKITAGGQSFVFTTPSDANSHNTAYLYVGSSSGTTNASTTNGSTHFILKDGSTYTRRKISGSNGTTVTSDSSGNITVSSPAISTSTSITTDTYAMSAKQLNASIDGTLANKIATKMGTFFTLGSFPYRSAAWTNVGQSGSGYALSGDSHIGSEVDISINVRSNNTYASADNNFTSVYFPNAKALLKKLGNTTSTYPLGVVNNYSGATVAWLYWDGSSAVKLKGVDTTKEIYVQYRNH